MPGATVWITGLPAAGKSTTASATAELLQSRSIDVIVLDGDELRAAMPTKLGFSREDRAAAVQSAGDLALRHAQEGRVAVTALVSPYQADRDSVRARHSAAGLIFVEVHMDTPVETCIERDPKDLYKKALAGEISHMTGIDDPFEAPEHPELRFTPSLSPEQDALLILEELERLGAI